MDLCWTLLQANGPGTMGICSVSGLTHTLQQWEHIRTHHRQWPIHLCRTLGTTGIPPPKMEIDGAYLKHISVPMTYPGTGPNLPWKMVLVGRWLLMAFINSFCELCLWLLQQAPQHVLLQSSPTLQIQPGCLLNRLASPGTPKGRTEICQCRIEREGEREREIYIYLYIYKII